MLKHGSGGLYGGKTGARSEILEEVRFFSKGVVAYRPVVQRAMHSHCLPPSCPPSPRRRRVIQSHTEVAQSHTEFLFGGGYERVDVVGGSFDGVFGSGC